MLISTRLLNIMYIYSIRGLRIIGYELNMMRRHVGRRSCRHDNVGASEEPTWLDVADMGSVVSATWRRHVGVSAVMGGKKRRHDTDISSQARKIWSEVEAGYVK